MSYEQFYNLREQPFSNTPDLRFYFEIPQHEDALTRLRFAINTMKGLAVLVGETGTGKTALARRLLEGLDDDGYESALLVILHSSMSAEWFLRKIALQIGVAEPGEEKVALLSQIYERLVEIHQAGKKAVVLIDEANMLQHRSILEELRGFLNLEVPGSKLITFILFGLPALEQTLAQDPPLAQRVALTCRLKVFPPEVTKAYVRHRLKVAGGSGDLFSDPVLDLVHRASGGVPRLINTLCDNTLLEGFLQRKAQVDLQLMQDVVRDLGLPQ
jgi:type II secretory pathway predicted ATPase ExeA